VNTSTTPAGDDKLKLQIKDAGAWRHIVTFSKTDKIGVLRASADLLRSLQQPRTTMRVVQGDIPIYFCAAPTYMWCLAGDAGVVGAGQQAPDAQDQMGSGELGADDAGCPHSLRHAAVLAPSGPAPARAGINAAAAVDPDATAGNGCSLCGDTGTWFGKVCVCRQTGSLA
jgi:hypothetical protein